MLLIGSRPKCRGCELTAKGEEEDVNVGDGILDGPINGDDAMVKQISWIEMSSWANYCVVQNMWATGGRSVVR